jgi:pSer/pThr/pTyr-binding forkhead associated (FHA) protein
MEVKLLIKKGSDGPSQVCLNTPDTLVGRQKGCKLRIPSETVSRRHCRLLFENERLYAEDLNSSNGTFVNGVRIHGRQVVLPGDQIEIGPVVFVANYLLVEVDAPPPIALSSGVAEGAAEEVVALDSVELAAESPTARPKLIPSPDEPVPLALAPDEEPAGPPLLDEELKINLSGDEELRDLLSKMK